MKKTAPNIPIRLPINSTVSPNSSSAGAHKSAINPPTTIIGIPTQKQICLEAMYLHHLENVYEVYDSCDKEFSISVFLISSLNRLISVIVVCASL